MSNKVFIDSSILGKSITVTGTDLSQCSKCPNPPASGVEYNSATHGASVYMKGTVANYIATTIADGSMNFGTGDFTMSCWLHPLAVSASFGNVFFRWGTWAIYRRSSDGGLNWGNDSTSYFSTSVNTFPLYTWTHFAVSRNSGTTRFFINGSQIGSFADTNNYTAADEFGIGKYNAATNWDGFISGVHIVVGTGLYTSAFTPEVIPTSVANTKLLLKFANIGVGDNSTRTPLITMGNVVKSSAQKKYGSNSILFPGATGDYVYAPANLSGFSLGSDDFTVEFWIYPTNSVRSGIVAYSSDYSFGIDYHFNGTRNINMWASSNGTSWNMIHSDPGGAGIGTISLTLNAWNHVAVTRSGNVFRSFVNGTLDKSVTVSGNIFTTNRSFVIGRWGTGTMPMNAYIDDFQLIRYLAKYTASFTPPTELSRA